ncbi:4601_t:CDS:2 [Entrophospora sp. SA101]|nr:6524_t:CDS:2 [Entrophospora sp. SA101]CAJ0833957.1 4601_t:CDS:2 [Entrophospora sp. SA101]
MSYNSVVLDELLQQTACYGLPYGIFGISCWAFTIFSVALTYLDFPLFSPWRWCKPYKSQDPLLAVIISAMVLGPAIYTCVYCHGEWQVILLAVGQLTPWSFKMLNDGVRARKVIAGDNKVQDPHNINGRYIIIGKILTILLAAGGWAGIIGLSIMLVNTTKAVTDWIWILFAVGLTAFVTMCSHIILAMVSGNWSGIAPAGAGLISSIIFFAGKRLLFFDFECNF